MNYQNQKNLNKFIKISLLSAIAVMLMYFDFPIPFLPFPWLKIDLSDIPALMGGFAFGPVAGVLIELLKNLLILIVKGTGTGFVGEMANFIIGASLVFPAAWIYHKNKSKKTAFLGMLVGSLSMQVIGIIANVYFLLPAYGMKMAPNEIVNYVTAGLLPFNGVKAIMVCGITYVVYKKVASIIFDVDSNFDSVKKGKLSSI
ncbi:ECF transporter S component [Clostridium sartagoforme]|uniref:Riboflavin transporter n=1 Tax=Clostridium sartagoforme TaxID=84031 RepID=A0A4S2DNC1_9CLOT|nr:MULTISPECIES: ECF transporter S component [Clostridium]MBS5939473.1 ECF transporter S component [Clostridium sp.]MDU5109586.1 ECF transporter S component [Clostridium sp.]TGY42563.1 ECF transporter S component [Clostridium sartagoforme]